MRKKLLLNVLLLSSLCIYGCKNNNTSSEQISPSVPESVPSNSDNLQESSEEQSVEITINGSIKNIFEEVIAGGQVFYNNTLIANVNETGEFSFVMKDSELATELDKNLTIKSDNYLEKTVSLNDVLVNDLKVDLGNITLIKAYSPVSSIQNPTLGEFALSTTRDSENLLVKVHFDYDELSSSNSYKDSEINLFISTNNVSTSRDSNIYRVTVNANGTVSTYNFGGLLLSSYKVNSEIVDIANGIDVNLSIPYKMINADKEDVIGLAMSLYSNVDEQTNSLLTLDGKEIVDVFNPTTYIRVDKNNNAFKNNRNDSNYLSDEQKAVLIKGHELRFSTPELNNKKNLADDFYLKSTKEEDGFLISMVGFGEFKDNEYVKLIFHTAETNGTGWAIQSSDLSMLVSKSKNAYQTNSTNFWGFVNFATSSPSSAVAPIYSDFGTYFTLTQKVLFNEIPGYSADKKVSLYAMEFSNGAIYDGVDYRNGMLINNVSNGDPADQSSYYVIQNTNASSTDNVMADFPIQFAMNADNIYAKIERKETSLVLKMRSYSTFDDTDYIRFIIHHEANDCTDWGLLKSDMSISIYKNVAYYQTGMVYFNENNSNQFHNNQKTIHTPTYSVQDGYFELTLEIEYIEFSYDVTIDNILKGCLVEYANGKESLTTSVANANVVNYESQKNWFSF